MSPKTTTAVINKTKMTTTTLKDAMLKWYTAAPFQTKIPTVFVAKFATSTVKSIRNPEKIVNKRKSNVRQFDPFLNPDKVKDEIHKILERTASFGEVSENKQTGSDNMDISRLKELLKEAPLDKKLGEDYFLVLPLQFSILRKNAS